MEEVKFYILNKKNEIITTNSIEEWHEFYSKIENRRIGYTRIQNYVVSTVFLEIDQNNLEESIFFETAIKGEDFDVIDHYETYESALDGHRKYCDLINSGNYIPTDDVAPGPKCGAKAGPDWKRFISHT